MHNQIEVNESFCVTSRQGTSFTSLWSGLWLWLASERYFFDLYTKKEGISLCRFKSWTILLIINYRTVKLNSLLTASWHRGVPLPIGTSYSCRTVHDVACIAFNFQGRIMLQIVSKDSSVLWLTRMRTWCFYIHKKKLENHYIMTNNLN